MDFEEDLKVIAVYEDSIDRAESDRIVVQDENGVLSPAGSLALIPDFEKAVHWYAEKCEDFLRSGFDPEAFLSERAGAFRTTRRRTCWRAGSRPAARPRRAAPTLPSTTAS